MSEVEVFEERVDQARIDELIWRGIGTKSVRQIADDAGVRPDEVLRRKSELLDEIDVLTIQEKRVRLMVQLQELANTAQGDYDASPWEFKAGLLNAAASSIKTVLQELARMEKQDESKITALNELRRRELLELVQRSVESTFESVAEEHGLEKDGLMDVFKASMVETAREMELQ